MEKSILYVYFPNKKNLSQLGERCDTLCNQKKTLKISYNTGILYGS